MKIRCYALVAIFLFLSSYVSAQNKVRYYDFPDILRKDPKSAVMASTDLETLFQKCYYYYYYTGANDTLKNACVDLKKKAEDAYNPQYVALAYILLNKYYGLTGQIDTALIYLDKADSVFKKHESAEGKLIYYKESGRTYKDMECDTPSAIAQLKLAEELLPELRRQDSIAASHHIEWNANRVYYNMAEVYLKIHDPNSAGIYARLAFNEANHDIDNRTDPYGKARAWIAMGKAAYDYSVQLNNTSIDTSDQIFLECIKYCQVLNMQYPLAVAYLEHGNILRKKNKIPQATYDAEQGLEVAKNIHFFKGTIDLYALLEDLSLANNPGSNDTTQDSLKYKQYCVQRDALMREKNYLVSVGRALNILIRKDMADKTARAKAEKDAALVNFLGWAFILFVIALFIALIRSFRWKQRNFNILDRESVIKWNVFCLVAFVELLSFLVHAGFEYLHLPHEIELPILLGTLIYMAWKFDTWGDKIKEWGEGSIKKNGKEVKDAQ